MGTESVEKEEDGSSRTMKPWEQHSAVINIPRFDYNAPTSLLHHSYSGFLVTCPIKREKSATKEAMSILEKCIETFNSCNSENLGSSDENVSAKRRKLCVVEVDAECVNGVESKSATFISSDSGPFSEGSCLSPLKSDGNVEKADVLSLVKLTRSGLLLFTFPRDSSPDVVRIVSNIIKSLESGSLKSPLWCHRFFPIQATCTLNEKELRQVVPKLVLQFVNDKRNKLARPIKFAVGYNSRGIKETEMKGAKLTSTDSDAFTLLDRNKCFGVVAAAVKDVVSDSVVDLNCPEVHSPPINFLLKNYLSPVVAVSVLPHNLVNTKPRLSVKALVSDVKASNLHFYKRVAEAMAILEALRKQSNVVLKK
ncbi:hypothetical protein LguiB_025332 [Lonicera macranthoides]